MVLNPLNAASAAHSLKPLGLGLAAAGSTAAISFVARAALNHMVKPEQFASKWAIEAVSVAIGAAAAVAVGASSVAVFVGCAVYGLVALSKVPVSSEQMDWQEAKAFVKQQNAQDSSGVVTRPRNALLYSESQGEEKYEFRKDGLKGIDSLTLTIVELESGAVTFSKLGEAKISDEHLEFYKEKYADGREEVRVAFKKTAPDPRSFIANRSDRRKAIYHATTKPVLYQLVGCGDGDGFINYNGNKELLKDKGEEEPVCKEAAEAFGSMMDLEVPEGGHQFNVNDGSDCPAILLTVHPRFGTCVSIDRKWCFDNERWDHKIWHVFPLVWSNGAVHLDMDKELIHVGESKYELKSESERQEHVRLKRARDAQR